MDDLLDVVADFNAFAENHGAFYMTINADWLNENRCYFVTEFLCPCVDGYKARLQSVMADGVFSREEQEDATVWSILDYCTPVPEPCPPPAVALPVPDLEIPEGPDPARKGSK
ncbi:MAG: hypothetical protein QM724_13365 [Flavobacteriales bacterium]